MKNAHKMLGATALLALLTACAGGTTGVPSGVQALQPSDQVTTDAASNNLSGQYAGTLKDNMHGTGKASALLSESKNALGGSLTITGSPTVEYISWIAGSGTVNGSSVFVAPSGYCTFSHAGKYNSKTHTLTGSYKATYGCSGETGSYTLKHRCYYKGTGGYDLKSEAAVPPC